MITDEQLDSFLGPIESPSSSKDFLGVSWSPTITVSDKLNKTFWPSRRIEDAQKSLNVAMGINDKFRKSEIERLRSVNDWWDKEGIYVPKTILSDIGFSADIFPLSDIPETNISIAEDEPLDGEEFPLLKAKDEAQLQSIRDVFEIDEPDAKKRISKEEARIRTQNLLLGIPESFDLLEKRKEKTFDEVAAEIEGLTTSGQRRESIILGLSLTELGDIERLAKRNTGSLPQEFVSRISHEVRVKRQMEIIRNSETPVLLSVIGAKFLKGPFNVFEFTSRIQNKTALVDLIAGGESGDFAVLAEAADRVGAEIERENPGFWKTVSLSSADIANALVEFTFTQGVLGRSAAFAKLSSPAKVALTAGVSEAVRLPAAEETLAGRAKSVLFAGETGFVVGTVFDELVKGINRIKGVFNLTEESKIISIIRKNIEGLEKRTDKQILSAFDKLRSIRPEAAEKIFVQATAIEAKVIPEGFRGRIPKGFRLGAAEIEKPGKAVSKAAKKIAKSKAKEAIAIESPKRLWR